MLEELKREPLKWWEILSAVFLVIMITLGLLSFLRAFLMYEADKQNYINDLTHPDSILSTFTHSAYAQELDLTQTSTPKIILMDTVLTSLNLSPAQKVEAEQNTQLLLSKYAQALDNCRK